MPSPAVVTPAAAASPVLIHVPHAARFIPADLRADLLVSDVELAAELNESTDTGTDAIAEAAVRHARRRPVVVINQLSRLVIDPERFPDATESANAFGRGAVYTRTCSGAPLRAEPYPRADELLDAHFRPYADSVADAVDDRLRACGHAVVIDLHSYPEKPSGFEDPAASRPPLCIGTDRLHTPEWLIDATRGAFASLGGIEENAPYAGCYVPLRHYGQDRRVASVMIELRRDTYLIDPSTPDLDRVDQLGRALATLIDAVTERAADV